MQLSFPWRTIQVMAKHFWKNMQGFLLYKFFSLMEVTSRDAQWYAEKTNWKWNYVLNDFRGKLELLWHFFTFLFRLSNICAFLPCLFIQNCVY